MLMKKEQINAENHNPVSNLNCHTGTKIVLSMFFAIVELMFKNSISIAITLFSLV